MPDGNTIQSVAKAMELLQLLSAGGRPMTLKEITMQAAMPKSTVFGLLTTMREYDVIEQTPDGKYALGLRLFEYGCQIGRSWDISAVAKPYMEHLAADCGVSPPRAAWRRETPCPARCSAAADASRPPTRRAVPRAF